MTADFPNYLLEMLSPDRIALEDKDEVIVRVSDNSIIVNPSYNSDQQTKMVIHGLVHYHPRFMSYSGGRLEGSIDKNEEVETEMMDFVRAIYRSRQDIVAFVRNRISEALANSPHSKSKPNLNREGIERTLN